MGLFDTVVAGARHGQVKCFGRGMRTIHVGDALSLYRPVGLDEQLGRLESATPGDALGVAADLAIGEPSELRDYQVAMTNDTGSESYLIVRDGVLIDWRDEPTPDLTRIDVRRRPLDQGHAR